MTGFAFRMPRSMVVAVRRPLALRLILLAGLAAAPTAWAADKAAPRTAATAPAAKSPILTPAQLEECENLKARLRTQTDEAAKEKSVLDVDKAELLKSGTLLDAELATLDRSSEAAVEAYNARAQQRDKQIDGYEARVVAYNAKAQVASATKDSHEKSCANRRYDERDLNDLKRKK